MDDGADSEVPVVKEYRREVGKVSGVGDSVEGGVFGWNVLKKLAILDPWGRGIESNGNY